MAVKIVQPSQPPVEKPPATYGGKGAATYGGKK